MEQLVETFLSSSDLASPYLNLSSCQMEIIDDEKNSPSLTQIHQYLLDDNQMQHDTKQKNKKKNRKKCEFHLKKRRKIRKELDWQNHQSFTFLEDQKILNLVLELGPKFADVQKHFADRSMNAIKNRYYKYLRFRWDIVLGRYDLKYRVSEYEYMNHKQVESSIQVSDLLDLVKQINFFPEASALMTKLVKSVDACLR